MFSITAPPAGPRHRPRVLLVTRDRGERGPACIENEVEALKRRHPVALCFRSMKRPPAAEIDKLADLVCDFGADVLHTHFLSEIPFIARLARKTGRPFTVRTHSSDTTALHPRGWMMWMRNIIQFETPFERTPQFVHVLRAVRSELCLGVLALPCARPWLVRAGLPDSKLVDCYPALQFERFHDRSPNGPAIMNIGLAAPRKPKPDFLKLARTMPGHEFNLYAPQPFARELPANNAAPAGFVAIRPRLPVHQMPAEYKKHRWLVYTGDSDIPAIGWPIAIAEAQASGVGVCVPRVRPDLARYVGEGAGVLYDSIDELPGIVAGSVPEEMRARAFEQAARSDIERHLHLLTDLWDNALSGPDALVRRDAPRGGRAIRS
ncbi:MAG: hypothetical protein ACOCYR_04665 [Erythrobacter sp.]